MSTKSLLESAVDFYNDNGTKATISMAAQYSRWRLSAWILAFRNRSSFDRIGSALKIRGDVRVDANSDATITIGDNVEIAGNYGRSTILRVREELEIADEVFVNRGCEIYASNRVRLGHNATLAPNVVIRDSDMHAVGDGDVKQDPVEIGKDVWIGTETIVLKGVTIGEGAVVGAGSVVTDDLPPGTLSAGVPASPIREIE